MDRVEVTCRVTWPMRALARAAFWAGMAISAGPAMANPMNPATASPGELARLPDYCNHVWGYYRDAEARAGWFARLGPVFEHMHHYCWGQLKANRAETPGMSPMMRRTLYASAVQECQYVLRNHPDPDFVLRPEILYRMGVYESAIESWVQAMDYFRQSIAAKPDYWPPYEGLAKIHMKLGRHDQALEVLNEGLKTNPTEPRLLEAAKRARERGGAGSRATVSR